MESERIFTSDQEEDIVIVCEQAQVSREEAIKALDNKHWDVVDAIMFMVPNPPDTPPSSSTVRESDSSGKILLSIFLDSPGSLPILTRLIPVWWNPSSHPQAMAKVVRHSQEKKTVAER